MLVLHILATLVKLQDMPIGLALASALGATLIWVFIDIGLISLEDTSVFVWVIELFAAMVLCLGMSWSHIRRRMTGQVDVDEVD